MSKIPDVPMEILAMLSRWGTPKLTDPFPLSDEARAKKEASLTTFLEGARREYEESGNPIHAWRAYAELRSLGKNSFPDWLLAYLDSSCDNLLKMCDPLFPSVQALVETVPGTKKFNPTTAIAEAMQFKKPGKSGRGHPISDVQNSKWLSLGGLVELRIRQGWKQYLAIEEVAKERGVSRATVQRAYRRFLATFKTPPEGGGS